MPGRSAKEDQKALALGSSGTEGASGCGVGGRGVGVGVVGVVGLGYGGARFAWGAVEGVGGGAVELWTVGSVVGARGWDWPEAGGPCWRLEASLSAGEGGGAVGD